MESSFVALQGSGIANSLCEAYDLVGVLHSDVLLLNTGLSLIQLVSDAGTGFTVHVAHESVSFRFAFPCVSNRSHGFSIRRTRSIFVAEEPGHVPS